MRAGITRESIVGKLISAVILSFILIYIIPRWQPSLFGLVVMILGIYIISDGIGKFFVDGERVHLLAPGMASVALFIFFIFLTPA